MSQSPMAPTPTAAAQRTYLTGGKIESVPYVDGTSVRDQTACLYAGLVPSDTKRG
jgi:hypothetical protein